MLRRTSKRIKEVVDKMCLPVTVVVRLSSRFWDDTHNDKDGEKVQIVIRHLTLMTVWCRMSTLELPRCDMKRQGTESLPGVLTKCPALANLDLSRNSNVGSTGTERLVGVLGQYRELVHLNLRGTDIRAGGTESLAGVLVQCQVLSHLDLGYNDIGSAGTSSLGELLGQCASLTHLNLRHNQIGDSGAAKLVGVLGRCTELAHLDHGWNRIGNSGTESFASDQEGQSVLQEFWDSENRWITSK